MIAVFGAISGTLLQTGRSLEARERRIYYNIGCDSKLHGPLLPFDTERWTRRLETRLGSMVNSSKSLEFSTTFRSIWFALGV